MPFSPFWVMSIILVCLAPVPLIWADTLHSEVDGRQQGYWPVEERSFEAIIDASGQRGPVLKIRVAIHNTSAEDHDFVARIALPRSSELIGFARNIEGKWLNATPVQDSLDTGRRDPSSVYLHLLSPNQEGGLPSAELIGFGLESGSTTQVEIQLLVYPELNGDHWQISLPSRKSNAPNLATFREVLVKGLRERDNFRVDEQSSQGAPKIRTRAIDSVTVAWPAAFRHSKLLSGRYEYVRNNKGKGGKIHLHLQLGMHGESRPDHVLLVVDRSKSTGRSFGVDSAKVFLHLLDLLPKGTTFDAISFARTAKPIWPTTEGKINRFPNNNDSESRLKLIESLQNLQRQQGSDLSSAFRLAENRLAQRRAKRPLILVTSDGVLPQLIHHDEVKKSLGKFAKSSRSTTTKAAVLFIVDDPLVARNGGAQSHPIVSLAGNLGAKLRFASLSDLSKNPRSEDLQLLLRSPGVLNNLQIRWPKYVRSLQPVPKQLIAGHVLHITAESKKRPPARLLVRGKMLGHVVSSSIRRSDRSTPAQAFATVENGIGSERTLSESLVRPAWYSRKLQRVSQKSIEASSRIGHKKTGTLDRKILRYHLRTRVLPRARACYNRSLQENNAQEGNVKLDIEVGKGEVMFAKIARSTLAYPDPKFHDCLIDAAWSLIVPEGAMDQKTYRLLYPLQFIAPEGGRPPQTHPKSDKILDSILPN